MAKKKTIWLSEDKKEYDTELEAVQADANFWKKKYLAIAPSLTTSPEVDQDPFGTNGERT